jgi:hypothetical protein
MLTDKEHKNTFEIYKLKLKDIFFKEVEKLKIVLSSIKPNYITDDLI